MSVIETELKRWGNSYGIIIPKDVIREHGLKGGDTIKVDFMGKKKVDGFGLLPEIGRFDREEFWRERV